MVTLELILSAVGGLILVLLGVIGYFGARMVRQTDAALEENRAQNLALREEVSVLKEQLKGYADLVKHLREEIVVLKRSYRALLRAFNALDKWLGIEAVQGRFNQSPPEFTPKQDENDTL
ncbi:hypothetical protein [Hymenobacter tenuis]